MIDDRVTAIFYKHADIRGEDECWPWTGSLHAGYGQIKSSRTGKILGAHRVAHELFNGPIPEGYAVDHLCHGWDTTCFQLGDCPHRACVNPRHLEAVTYQVNRIQSKATEGRRANLLAKTHCPKGHELTPENTFSLSRCLRCLRRQQRENARKRKGPIVNQCEFVSRAKKLRCQRESGHEGRHYGGVPKLIP